MPAPPMTRLSDVTPASAPIQSRAWGLQWGTASNAKEWPSPKAPHPGWGDGKARPKALWEPVLTPSCSTGCTFHSESSGRRGLGEVRQRGGKSGLLWGGSPREL